MGAVSVAVRKNQVQRLAHWRETGAWWSGEAPLEIVQWRDHYGTRRERIRELPRIKLDSEKVEWFEDNSVEITLRPRKTRDEKVSKALYTTDESCPQSLVFSGVGRSKTYAPLHLVSGYTFGYSTLLAQEVARLVAQAGCTSAALVDRHSLTGAVEFARECQSLGVKPLIGSTFELDVGGEITLIARDKAGYESLSQLVTSCHLDEPRLFSLCRLENLARYSRGLLCLTGGDLGRLDRLVVAGKFQQAKDWVEHLVSLYGKSNVFIEIERSWLPWGLVTEQSLLELASHLSVTPVCGGAVLHATREDFPAQDVVLCAQTLCRVEEVIGRKPQRDPSQPNIPPRPARSLNAERYLRTPQEMYSLYHDRPELVMNTLLVAERCDDDVLPARTRLPKISPDSATHLRELTEAGARHYHKTMPDKLKKRIQWELDRIIQLGFSDHFITAWDMCNWAREQHIHFSGRGSVVDSAVAYCLGFSRIDAYKHNLLFDRFLPCDGSKRPDIDIDFEANRREDIRQYLVEKYGADRVATVAAIGAYNTRGIVREVGKALGLSDVAIGLIAKRLHGGVSPEQLENALEKRPELRDSAINKERLHWLFVLAKKLADVPRNMRAHSSGVVISDRPLCLTVPVMLSGEDNVKIIQWDKRSAKYYFDKFDVLCLRGQDVLSGTERRVKQQSEHFDVEQVPVDSEENFQAMRSGHLIGVPQSASPAMRQAHMRLKTENLHDASLVQAGIRPGVGGAVKLNELILRRRGLKSFSFEHPDFEPILGLTYGIVVFQEQIDQLLQVFAGYSGGDAEDIRDAIHKRRREDYGETIKQELIDRVIEKGYSPEIAEQVYRYVSEFKGYGFAQGHALAFSEISLRSIHCQQSYPAEYFASLLDAQPAGYYGPCTLVNEARSRGVAIMPVDINKSDDSFSVENTTFSGSTANTQNLIVPNGGIRISLRSISGLSRDLRRKIVKDREGNGLYRSFHDFVRRVAISRDELESLIIVGAFDGCGKCYSRRALLWGVPQALAWAKNVSEGLFEYDAEPSIDTSVPDFTTAEKAIRERAILGLDVKSHLMSFERARVSSRGGVTCQAVKEMPAGRKVIVVGNPIRLRFPPTPSGKRVVFFDLEDESGLLNVTCFDRAYQRDGHAFVTSPYVTLIGKTQWRDGHSAFLIERAFPYQPEILNLVDLTEPLPIKIGDYLVS